MQYKMKDSVVLRDFGNGLIMRRGMPEDAEALAEFDAKVHSEDGPENPDHLVGAWVRDLLTKPHPTTGAQDFTIVVDTNSGAIVSSMNLIPQTWSYEGISFGVGRPELVGTLPEYRNKGLIRAQFDVIHGWSAERGHLLQAITGIPYYYRLFGYEMALSLGGGRAGFLPQVPKLKEGEEEPYQVRKAVGADLPFIAELYEKSRPRYLVSCEWDMDLWRYELTGKDTRHVNRFELRVIQTPQREPVGFLAHPFFRWAKGTMMAATRYELKAGVSWAAVTPTIIRYLIETGKTAEQAYGKGELGSFGFMLGKEHPVYELLNDRLPVVREPYAWYIRLADLPAFLKRITPVLERRLEASPFTGHSGELKITFYKGGIQMTFEKGRISAIDHYRPTPVGHEGDAGFPGLTFLQLLFGYRDMKELKYAFPDCWANSPETQALLTSLFPKKVTDVWPVS